MLRSVFGVCELADGDVVLSLLCYHITILARHLDGSSASSKELHQRMDVCNIHPVMIEHAHVHELNVNTESRGRP